MLTSVLLVVGFIFLITGILLMASNYDIKIKNIRFDCDTLGLGLTVTGGMLVFLMLFAKGFAWMTIMGG